MSDEKSILEIKNKVNDLFATAEKEYKVKLTRPAIHISVKPVVSKQENTVYLTNKEIKSNKIDRIINRKTVSVICDQLFGDPLPHQRRILKLKIGIKSNLRHPENFEKWDWSRGNAELGRKYKLSRERVRQLRELLSK